MARLRIARGTLAASIALLMAGFLVVSTVPDRADARQRTGRRVQMVNLTNDDRREHDRRALGFETRVSRFAKEHSAAMARKGYIFHSTEAQLRRALGDVNWSIGGENVGVGGSLKSLEEAFMASKLHRENILRKSFDHMAVGIVREDDALWITVIFYG